MTHHEKSNSSFSGKMYHLVILIMVFTLTLVGIAGCNVASSQTPEPILTNQMSDEFLRFTGVISDVAGIESTFTSDDFSFDWQQQVYTSLKLDGDTIISYGEGVSISGSIATITASGIYEVSGTLADGSIEVNIDKSQDKNPVILVLNGVDITSKTSAPIHVKSAAKVILLLEAATENRLADTAHMLPDENNEPRATIFSKDDLSITGDGTLTITANYNDAINGRDDVYITGGSLIIDSVADGIVGKDSVQIAGGSLTITAEKDGIRSTNDTDSSKGNIIIYDGQFSIDASADTIQAENTLYIADGSYHLISGGGYPGHSTTTGNETGRFGMRPEGLRNGAPFLSTDAPLENSDNDETDSSTISQKGLKAGANLIIDGGYIDISSYDDAVHSDGHLSINDGTLLIETGDDAIHSDDTLVINGGEITITNAYEGIESASITINGGSIYINADDDGINVNESGGIFILNGGDIHVIGRGDGIDSNGDIRMLGGSLRVDGLSMGMEGAIDYDGVFEIGGGDLVALGSATLSRLSESDLTQPMIYMQFSVAQPAGTLISLQDSQGNEILSHTSSMDAAYALFSSPELTMGSKYAVISDGLLLVSVTLENTVTYLSESGVTDAPQNMMPGGGRQRGGSPMVPQGPADSTESFNEQLQNMPQGFNGEIPVPPEGFGGERPPRQGIIDEQPPAQP
ncbi:carbohydrate-binding domain-containing protein [Anoxynatronum buryatiense]|uniref:Carbohydrate-binding domain-containing protein n=1 Tax=Anoxynatronum buryatiense TaxID=489973 RepID=A0AA46AIA0_9CLOT|nr:carbohydrate-binding domain-containing protein [Anoxynatronum buryatiense]SMP48196.1 protein of unknown function [Anoxynatronum buryatiense]